MYALGTWAPEPGGHSLGELAARLDWRVRGSWARGRCPLCDARTAGWALVDGQGRARVGCFSCERWQELRRLLGLDGGQDRPAPTFVPTKAHGSGPKALCMEQDADVLAGVYEIMSRHMAMPAEQRRRVLGRDRGIPAGLREGMAPLLRSLPAGQPAHEATARAMLAELKAAFDYELLRRVPELLGRRGQGLALASSLRTAAYLEPWRDEQGRTLALRGYFREGDAKYRTTYGRWGPLLHVAYGVPRDAAKHVPWLLTEGWMKAEVAAQALGVVAVAFPGVSAKASWQRALRIKQRIAPDAPTYVAYDAEVWTTRPDIATTAFDLAREVRWIEGRCAGFAAWSAEPAEGGVSPKGIDDAIVGGREVRLVDRLAFGEYLAPALERWEGRDAA